MGVFLTGQPGKTSCPGHTHLKAGSRPKKATKVTSDTVTVKRMMLRARVMVRESSKWPNWLHNGTIYGKAGYNTLCASPMLPLSPT